MKLKFYLARPKSKTETSIVANIHLGGQLMRIGTGLSIEPKYWNPKTHQAKSTPAYRAGSSLNVQLDKIKGKIEKCFYDYQNEHDASPSQAAFKNLIDLALGRTKDTKMNFFEYYQDFINRTNTGQRRTLKNGHWATVKPSKAYTVTLNNLKRFDKQWRKKLDFDTIDLDFYTDYTNYLQHQKLSQNTIGRDIKNIKAVLKEATDKGVNKNLAFQSKKFAKLSEEVENVALSEKELQDLENIDLSGRPHLAPVRDLFLIGCYTGLRYSDFSRLTSDDIKDGFIEIRQQKTGKPVAIPVHTIVKKIIGKYNGNLPGSISNQKTNDYLKEVCKLVPSLCVAVSKTGTKGGMQVAINYEKWQIITTHTARRTFATNAYLQKIPTVTIMAITGHKTEKSFLKYIKVTPKEHAEIMASIWESRGKMKIAN